MNTKLRLASILLLATTIISCSKIQGMSDNAEEASENSGKAAEAASESREEIAYSRLMARAGATSTARRDALSAMEDMETFHTKATEASKYVKAFEFQLWTGQRYDSSKYLLALYEDAMREFFRSLYEVNDDISITQTKNSIFNMNNKHELNVAAIAIAMHGENNVQKYVTVETKSAKGETESIYSVIKKALIEIHKVENGVKDFSELEEYQKIVFNYKDEAMELIQTRLNTFLSLAIVKLSPIKDSFWSGVTTKVFGKNYKSRFAKMNLGEKYQVNQYFYAAEKVKIFLDQIGVPLKINDDVNSVFENMLISDNTVTSLTMNKDVKKELNRYDNYLNLFFKVNNNRLYRK